MIHRYLYRGTYLSTYLYNNILLNVESVCYYIGLNIVYIVLLYYLTSMITRLHFDTFGLIVVIVVVPLGHVY